MLLGPVPVLEGQQIVNTLALVPETEGLLSHVCRPYGTHGPTCPALQLLPDNIHGAHHS